MQQRLSQKTGKFLHYLYPKKERNMLIAERFLSGLAKIHGNHPISTDGRMGIRRLVGF